VISSTDVVDALASDVGLVAVSDVQSQNGVRLDTGAILRACRSQGTLLFVNTTQSAGVLRPATGADLPDFTAAHSYKWQLAPRGAAWLGVAGDTLDALRGRSANWKNAPDPIRNLYGGPLAWDASARRLDASLAWFPWVGARAALELLGRHDAAAVEHHALALASSCRDELERRGADLAVSELPTHLLGVRYPDEAAAQAEQHHLHAHDIAVSARGAWLRIGFHGFNTFDEVDRLLAAIRLR
jgi:selenocysteine lyase/cysteine desulfurase